MYHPHLNNQHPKVDFINSYIPHWTNSFQLTLKMFTLGQQQIRTRLAPVLVIALQRLVLHNQFWHNKSSLLQYTNHLLNR